MLSLFAPRDAHAWWNKDWAFRKKIVINRGPNGVPAGTEIAQYPALVRLTVGNFRFNDAMESGADLRIVSSDDKTLLSFHIERYDWIGQVGYLWVQLPLLSGADAPPYIWIYFGHPGAAAAVDAKATFDPGQTLAFHFGERDGPPLDATGFANHAAQSNATRESDGMIDAAAFYDGSMRTTVAATPSLKLAAKGDFTFSAWVKPQGSQSATLFRQQDGGRSLTIALDNDQPVATVVGDDGSSVATAPKARLTPDEWHYLAVTASDRLVVYVDGTEVSAAAVQLPEIGGDVTLGGMPAAANGVADAAATGAAEVGFKGRLDEVRLAREARSAAWLKLDAAIQRPESRLLDFGEDEQLSGGGEYLAMMRVLASSVSVDGWIVIALIGLLGFISGEVAVEKARMLRRISRANDLFLEIFRGKGTDALALGSATPATAAKDWKDSPLFAVYTAGAEELGRLLEAQQAGARFSSLSLEVVRAAVDTSLVKEANRISERMVLLTLAVSGAPFLGLLGTVVGIMITFATIALKGDVNINTIAPGIAAAITATAAGMLVAIPALFSYNVLITRIKAITMVMEMFRDELLSKIAVKYS
jgi:biopolymer transport protein ExbB